MTTQVIATQASTGVDGLIMGRVEFISDEPSVIEQIRESLPDLAPGKMIVKCKHCGQFAARKTACGYCGAPVE